MSREPLNTEWTPEYLAWLRGLTMEERGELIVAKCEEAAIQERERAAAGLPPEPEEPYPASTMEFLRRCTAEYRKRVEQQKAQSSLPSGTNCIDESH